MCLSHRRPRGFPKLRAKPSEGLALRRACKLKASEFDTHGRRTTQHWQLLDLGREAAEVSDALSGRLGGHLGAGQEATYVAKAQDADGYCAAGYPADTTGYPYIAAESAATGLTPAQTADRIIATRDAWQQLNAQIEATRIGAKDAARAAADDAARLAIVAAAEQQLAVFGS